MKTTDILNAHRTWRAKGVKSITLIFAAGTLLLGARTAQADTTNLFPNGGFDSPAGAGGGNAGWVEVFGGGTTAYAYPLTGGNPGSYGIMDNTAAPAGSWAIWVGGNADPLPISPMGLVAGGTYNFVLDMKTFTSGGGFEGGVNIESWGPAGYISNSGELRAGSESAIWETYTFSVTLDAAATGIKVVPLWAQAAKVGYDNIGVVVPPQSLLASITSPAEGDTVSSIAFTINASAVVSPGNVTNVSFYDGASLIASDTTYPYSFTYNGASVGSHTLTVVAKDNQGGVTTSAAVNITVAAIALPPPPAPTNNAPTPIWPASKVINWYDSVALYPQLSPCNWTPWGSTGSRGDYTITAPGGRVIKSYLGLGYAGVEVNPTYSAGLSQNLANMTTMHVDVWTKGNQLAIQLQSVFGINGNVGAIYLLDSTVITSNVWIGLDIPLSVFTNITPTLDLTHIDQLLWIDNFGPGIQNSDYFFDNVYFYNNTPVIQNAAKSGTNFTLQVASSNPLTAPTGTNYVLQATTALTPANWTSLKTNVGTGGMLTFTNPVTTGNKFFRIKAQ